jgi:hypothetical protein
LRGRISGEKIGDIISTPFFYHSFFVLMALLAKDEFFILTSAGVIKPRMAVHISPRNNQATGSGKTATYAATTMATSGYSRCHPG